VGWSLSVKEYVFGRPGERCMAYIVSRSHNVYFLSAFAGGAVALTCDSNEGEDFQAGDYSLQHVPGKPLRDVLAQHCRLGELFVEKGHRSLPAQTLEDFRTAARLAATHPEGLRELRRTALGFVGLLAGLFLGSAGVLGVLFGFNSPAPWLGVLVSGLWIRWQVNQSSIAAPVPSAADNAAELEAVRNEK
jgi:hypothetical protein